MIENSFHQSLPEGTQTNERPDGYRYVLPPDKTTNQTLEVSFDDSTGTVQVTEYLAGKERRGRIIGIVIGIALMVALTQLAWSWSPGKIIIGWLLLATALVYVWLIDFRHRVVIVGPAGTSAGTNRPLFGRLDVGRDNITSIIAQRGTADRSTETMQELIAVDHADKHHHLLKRTSLDEVNWLAKVFEHGLGQTSSVHVLNHESVPSERSPQAPAIDLARPSQEQSDALAAIRLLGLDEAPPTVLIRFEWNDAGLLLRAEPIRRRWSRWYRAAAIAWILLMCIADIGYLLMLPFPTVALVLLFVMMPPFVLLWLIANSLRDTVVVIRIDEVDLFVGAVGDDSQSISVPRRDIADIVLTHGRHFILETKLEQREARWFALRRGHSMRVQISGAVPYEVRLPYDERTCGFLIKLALRLARSGSIQT